MGTATTDSGPERDAGVEVPGWIALATSGPVVRRSLVFFFLVGGVLVALNHGDALLRGDVDGARLLKMALTPLVPYLVSTFSSVSAIRENHRQQRALAASPGPSAQDPETGTDPASRDPGLG